MRGLRINEGKKLREFLDKYDGAVYDTSHIMAAHVIKYHLYERMKERRRGLVGGPGKKLDLFTQSASQDSKNILYIGGKNSSYSSSHGIKIQATGGLLNQYLSVPVQSDSFKTDSSQMTSKLATDYLAKSNLQLSNTILEQNAYQMNGLQTDQTLGAIQQTQDNLLMTDITAMRDDYPKIILGDIDADETEKVQGKIRSGQADQS